MPNTDTRTDRPRIDAPRASTCRTRDLLDPKLRALNLLAWQQQARVTELQHTLAQARQDSAREQQALHRIEQDQSETLAAWHELTVVGPASLARVHAAERAHQTLLRAWIRHLDATGDAQRQRCHAALQHLQAIEQDLVQARRMLDALERQCDRRATELHREHTRQQLRHADDAWLTHQRVQATHRPADPPHA